MWEKLSDYFIDISKYLITAAFILAVALLGFALYFDKKGKKEKEAKRKKYNKFNNKNRRM